MTELPRELLGDSDDVAPPAAPPSPPSSTEEYVPTCMRCGSKELDDGDCPPCSKASLEERIRAAQEDRIPEEWAVALPGGERKWGEDKNRRPVQWYEYDLGGNKFGSPIQPTGDRRKLILRPRYVVRATYDVNSGTVTHEMRDGTTTVSRYYVPDNTAEEWSKRILAEWDLTTENTDVRVSEEAEESPSPDHEDGD